MERYNSKVGLELIIPVSILMFGGLMLASANKNWPVVSVIFLAMLFVLHVFLTTWYEVNGHMLNVRCGFLINKDVDIRQIVSIKETYNPLSAPAVSIDRLEIKMSGKDSILISPLDKEGFINALLKVKPGIKVTRRNRPAGDTSK